MMIKIFSKNENNKIEFTEEELKKLLDEVYKEGYNDGKNNNVYTYYTPSITWTPDPNPWWTHVTCVDATNTTSNSNINIKGEQ